VPITQTYTFYHDGSTALYAMSNPVYLDRTAKVTFNAIPPKYSVPSKWPTWTGSKGPWVEEITYIRSNAAVDKGERYQVVSAVSLATIDELKEAGADYPVWVTERYLQLPDTITERTRQLARAITEPFADPFSKAQAIERHMRTEIKYNEQIAAPPPDVDKVDYILFELKEAYCDYYASSMIVMLRSVGIPARLAVGFAQGDYDVERGVYHVVNADAHSWVEVYFPRYGWVEFEPTAAQPDIVRLVAPENDGSGSGDLPDAGTMFDDGRIPGKPEEDPLDEEIAGRELPAITFNLPLFGAQINIPWSVVTGGMTVIGIVLLAGLAVVGFWWRQQQMQASQSIFNLYQNMVRLAGWMGAGLRPWQTPYEHAGVLQHHLPTHQSEVETITNEYVHHTFSPTGAEQDGAKSRLTIESSLAWRRLRSEMIKAAIKRRLRW
jgi:hypothetical protein